MACVMTVKLPDQMYDETDDGTLKITFKIFQENCDMHDSTDICDYKNCIDVSLYLYIYTGIQLVTECTSTDEWGRRRFGR